MDLEREVEHAEDLVDPVPIVVPIVGAASLPAELWWPRRTAGSPPALLWIEDDAESPAWMEFHPFLQFLANRGVAVLRLRLRGARGFGRTFRHAADGRLVEAGLEDLEAARAELARRGVDPQRIAVLGEGAWPGAIAATALAERSGRFAAAIDLGGDPDPLRQQDFLPTLVEPARTWWLTRLGDPTAEPVRRERERIRAAATSGAAWVDAAPGTSGPSTARSSRNVSRAARSRTASCLDRTSSGGAGASSHAARRRSPASVRAVATRSKRLPRPKRSRSSA